MDMLDYGRIGRRRLTMQDTDSHNKLSREDQRRVVRRVVKITLIAVIASVAITTGLGFLVNGTQPDTLGMLIAIIAPMLIASVGSYPTIRLSQQLRHANERLKALSETDPLTDTLNRRKFMQVAERELALAERHCYPTSVVLIDFDDFKQVNDKYGHAAGDTALVQTIGVIKSVIRDTDVLGRFGGEEFILLLPHTACEGAERLTQRVLDEVAQTPIQLEKTNLTITVSAGSVTCETSRRPLDVLMSRADELLYESKQNGRNCCTAETMINFADNYPRPYDVDVVTSFNSVSNR
jgi:diguanylate cyclase (GGDEF)-like protein